MFRTSHSLSLVVYGWIGAASPGHTMPASAHTHLPQVGEDPRRPIDTAAGSIGGTDEPQQALILDCPVRQRLMQPLVEAATGNLQHPTHRGHPVLVAMDIDEPVLYSGSVAKYRAVRSIDRCNTLCLS